MQRGEVARQLGVVHLQDEWGRCSWDVEAGERTFVRATLCNLNDSYVVAKIICQDDDLRESLMRVCLVTGEGPGSRKLVFTNVKRIPAGSTPIIPARSTANAPVQDMETLALCNSKCHDYELRCRLVRTCLISGEGPGTRKLIFNNLKKIPRGNTPIIPAWATANAPVQDVETFEFDARTSIDIDIG